MVKALSAEQFLKDVDTHKMTVLVDNAPYRHLKFRQDGDSNMWFELVTWPGTLAISGDMGSWTFSRVDDMFRFFRSETLKINPSYWEEKLTSESRFGGPSREFDKDTFKANVVSSLEGYSLSEKTKRAIERELKCYGVFQDESEHRAMEALEEFTYGGFRFQDISEIHRKTFTFHYLWSLYAIVWGIQQYDAAHNLEAASPCA